MTALGVLPEVASGLFLEMPHQPHRLRLVTRGNFPYCGVMEMMMLMMMMMTERMIVFGFRSNEFHKMRGISRLAQKLFFFSFFSVRTPLYGVKRQGYSNVYQQVVTFLSPFRLRWGEGGGGRRVY